MYAFLSKNSDVIAHEAYFNTGIYQLYPVKSLPNSNPVHPDKF